MLKLQEFFGKDSFYRGNNGEWYVVFDYSRDSEIIDRANLQAIKKLYGIDGKKDAEFPPDICIERASHWAVGWVEYILINPDNTEFVAIGEKIEEKLKNYPILDEYLYSAMQVEEFTYYLEDAIKDYNNRHNTPFDYDMYSDQCFNIAYDRSEVYIDCYDLEKIAGTEGSDK